MTLSITRKTQAATASLHLIKAVHGLRCSILQQHVDHVRPPLVCSRVQRGVASLQQRSTM
jgi:hypothetical protein